MTPIDILIRSGLDPKGFTDAQKASDRLSETIKAGMGIEIGQKIVSWLGQIPAKFVEGVKEGIEFNAMIEQQTIAFGTLLQSATAAQQRVQELFTFAAVTPFQFQEVVQADRMLQSLTSGALAGTQGLRLVGDAAAAAAVPFQEAALWIGRLYGGLQNGTPVGLATERLSLMGLVSGDVKTKLDDLAQSGGAIGRGMEVIERTFAKTSGAMEALSKTFNGQISTLKDNLKQIEGIATADLFEGMKNGVAKLNEAMSNRAVLDYVEALRDFLTYGAKFISGAGPAQAAGQLSVKQDPGKLTAQTEALEGAIRRVIKSKLEAFDIDGDEAARLAKILRLNSEIADAAERLTKARELAAFIGRDKALPNAASRGLLDGHGEVFNELPMSDAQKKAAEEIEKALTAAKRDGMNDRVKLKEEEEAKQLEVENVGFRNAREMSQALADVEKTYDIQRAAAAAAEMDEAEKNLEEQMKRATAYRMELLAKENKVETDALQVKRDSIALERAMLDADFRRPEFEKKAERIKLMKEEIAALSALIEKKKEQRDVETDAAAREGLNQQILGLGGEKRQLEIQQVGLAGQADPFSFAQQMRSTITSLRNEWGTAAEQMATSFKEVFNSAISTISSGITGLIMGTQTWAQALSQIGMSILQSIIQAIVQMGVRWIATQIMMAVAGKAIQAAMVTANIPLAEAASAIWATPATLATIASYGAAADMAPAFIEIAQGAVMAQSLLGGSFKAGGYTGDGDPGDVAGLAHRGEFYFTAPQTAAIGRDNLAALARGGGWSVNAGGALAAALQAGGGGIAGGSGGGGKPVNVHVGYLGDQSAVQQFLESHEGEKIIVDVFNRRRLDLGMGT